MHKLRHGIWLLTLIAACATGTGCSQAEIATSPASPSRSSPESDEPQNDVQVSDAHDRLEESDVTARVEELIAILKRMEERQATAMEEEQLYRAELMALLNDVRGLLQRQEGSP